MVAKKKTAAQAVKAAAKAAKTAKRVLPGGGAAAAAQREAIFIEAYLANGKNATQAAIVAGFAEGSAKVRGCNMLKRPHVAAALAAREKELLDKHKLTADEVIASLARALRFDPRKLRHPDGSFKELHELDDETALAINAVEFGMMIEGKGAKAKRRVFLKKVTAADKNTAREQGMKHFGLFKVDNSQRVDPIRQLMDEIGSRGVGLPVKP